VNGSRTVSLVQSEVERYDSSILEITEEQLREHLEFMVTQFDRETEIPAEKMVDWVYFAHVDVPLAASRPTRLSETGPYVGEFGDRATMLSCESLIAAIDSFAIHKYAPDEACSRIALHAAEMWSVEALSRTVPFGTSRLSWEGVLGLVHEQDLST